MIREHERAVLTVDLPETDFKMGDVGTVVHIYVDGAAYEMEFFTLDGRTLDVVTVEAEQVRPVRHSDILHVRELSA
ncbi:MAG: DUF4926 domain-containing protein [Anaerolineae bacterium]|nr:DUF4926 domain-containing protein [Anaerolineae bacterium]